VVEVGLAYEQDVARGMKVLQQIGDEWVARHEDIVLEAAEAQGVLGLNASDVGLRLVVKVKPSSYFAAERELRLLVKQAFDAAGVEIPFPRHVVYHRQEAADSLSIQTTTNGSSRTRSPTASP
jgi:small conductance mechanosensitive channel